MLFGETICDMHHGLSLPNTLSVIQYVKIETSGGSLFIETTVRQYCPDYEYLNKLLVIIGEDSFGNILAAYSYDERSFAVYTLKLS